MVVLGPLIRPHHLRVKYDCVWVGITHFTSIFFRPHKNGSSCTYTYLRNARLLSNRTISDNIMILLLRLDEVVHSYHFPFAEEFCLPSTSWLLRKFSGQNHS